MCGVGVALWALVWSAQAFEARAFDARLGDDALELVGGKLSGTRIAYAQIDPDKTELIGHRLVIARRGADRLVLSVPTFRDEWVGARGLALSLRNLARTPQHLRADPAKPNPAMLACPICRVPTPPTDAESITCAACNTVVGVPEEIRARVAAARHVREVEAHNDERMTAVLEQPAAARVNALVAIAFAASFGLAGVLLYAIVSIFSAPGLEVPTGARWAFLGAAIAATSLVILGITDRAIARRRAGCLLTLRCAATLDFGARGWACRFCGAIGDPARAELILRCAYCGTANVRSALRSGETLEIGKDEWADIARELDRARRRGAIKLALAGALAATAIAALVVWLA